MPTLIHRYGVALALVVLVCGFARCKTPGGPFVTITFSGVPAQTKKLVVSAKLGETERPAETVPKQDAPLPLTIDLPVGARGPLLVSAQALVDDSCTLFKGAVTVELTDDVAYEATLPLGTEPLTECGGKPSVILTLNKMENGGTGSVSSDSGEVSCGAGCTSKKFAFEPGAMIMLTAQPAIGTQVKWSDPTCGANLSCRLTLTANTTLTATFTACKGWCNEGSPTVITNLNAVWGAGSSVFAVGDAGRILTRTNLGQWSPMTSNASTNLRTIGQENGSTTPYVGGDSGTLLLLNGATWNPVALPDAVKGKQITGFTGDRLTNLFFFLCTGDGGFYFKTNEADWTALNNTALTGKVLHGVAAANKGLFGGGREAIVVGSSGVVVHWGQNAFNNRTTVDNTNVTVTAETLNGVWAGSGVLVAVGDKGTVITRGSGDYDNNSKVWTKVDSMVQSRLNAVWGSDDNNVWLVGDGGTILKYDNSKKTITAEANVPAVDLYGVWAADGNKANVYAVGKGGAILRYFP